MIRVAVLLLVAAISSVATLVWVTMSRLDQRVQLTADLGGRREEAGKAFGARVRQSFPLGSSEATMIADLQNQGFVSTAWSAGPERSARRTEEGFPCVIDAEVNWRADAAGRIVAIGSNYRGICP